ALQAAEYFFRLHMGLDALNACHPTQANALSENHWRIEMMTADGASHWVELARDKAVVHTYINCRDEAPAAQDQFRLIRIG
ncbi:MAG: hypothetical protein RMN25_13755, partial [Anaerolineae bacterium]|nr:hypothetical protein [Thermoflexales bacterium]MDW8408837.1 hypothetical protein [Anaerolineae bacterium]